MLKTNKIKLKQYNTTKKTKNLETVFASEVWTESAVSVQYFFLIIQKKQF